jgi:hypothetical protein
MINLLIKTLLIICFCITSLKSLSQDYTIQFSAPGGNSVFLLPVPNNKIAVNAEINITNKGEKVESNFSVLNTWASNSKDKFIRLLLIELKNSNNAKKESTQNFVVEWVNSETHPRFKTQTKISSPYLVYPAKSWLAQSILLHPKANNIDNNWYIEPQTLFANFITDVPLLTEHNYPPKKYSQWLFDRPRAIYQMFIMTGDKRWLTEAEKLTEFYLENLDETGQFTLKKELDLKYLMPNGLLYHYFLTGDKRIESALKNIFTLSLHWSPNYENRRKFWTERHQASALNAAISYWEISGSTEAKHRIDEILDATVKMVFYPQDQWTIKNCPQHTYLSHEGKAGQSPVCSPWMMALLADGLWRYYLLTEDKRAGALLNAFGDFILNEGIYFADDRLKNKVLPLYLASISNKLLELKNQWTDGQHVCDISGLIGKSLYIKKLEGEDPFILKELFNAFIEQCKNIVKKGSKKKKNYILMLPPRRFGWTYSTTSDLPWLEQWLNQDPYKK